LRASVEPLRRIQVELTAMRMKNQNYSTTFRYNGQLDDRGGVIGFENATPFTNGTFSISSLSIMTAFKDHNTLYKTFEENLQKISQRLGEQNPHSNGSDANGFAEGYGKNAQDVVVNAFLVTYGSA